MKHNKRPHIIALVVSLEPIYEECGGAEAHGIALLFTKSETVAAIYMLSEVFKTSFLRYSRPACKQSSILNSTRVACNSYRHSMVQQPKRKAF